jgi:hypothetical protein
MQLSDLLYELRNNILHDRTDRFEGTSDYLWSDETLVRYINEAQRRFARQSLCLRDGNTAAVTRFTIQTGVQQYTLHPSVIAVLSVRMDGDHVDLARAGHSTLDTYRVPDNYYFDPGQIFNLPPGKPLAYATDEYLSDTGAGSKQIVSLRIFPEPAVQYDSLGGSMRVVRLPINPLTLDNLSATPEIPEDHHLEMLDWAAYLALRIVDTDAGAPARAQEFAQSFAVHVKAARDLAMRKLFTPQQWGFGRNAFSWETN